MHPVLVHIGPVKVFSYGVMVVLGFLSAVWWSVRSGRRRGLADDDVLDAAVWIFLPALVGARFLYVWLHRPEYTALLDLLRVWEGGMSFHGGLFGGIAGGLLFASRRRISPWTLADVAAPGVALAYGIGRIGCLLNGCCYGVPASVPWAMRFHEAGGGLTPPSHPTQIYSSLAGFAMFGLLAGLDRKAPFRGATGLAFLFLYSVYRFLIEFLRAGAEPFVAGLTQAQAASIVVGVAAMAVWLWCAARTRRVGDGR